MTFKQKICFVVADYRGPWAEAIKNNARDIIQKLSNDYDIFTISPSDNTDIHFIEGIKSYHIKSPFYLTKLKRIFYAFGIINLIKKSKKIMKREKPDIIITSLESPSVGFIGSVLKKYSKKPIKFIQIVNSDFYTKGNSPLKYWLMDELPHLLFNNKFFFKKGLKKADLNIAITKHLFKKTKSMGIKNSIYIPYGVDIKKFKKINKKYSKKFTIGYLGHLIYGKGAGLLLESFKEISSDLDIKLNLATTWGSEEEIIKKYPNIDNFGILKNQNNFYNSCDLFVLPLRFPFATLNMPQVILEAQASGTPVLASDLKNIKEVIKNNKNGFLFKSNNIKSLSNKIIQIYKNKESLEKIAKKARKNIEKNYDFKKTIRIFKKTIQNILK